MHSNSSQVPDLGLSNVWCLDLYDWHARRVWLQAQTDKQGFALLVVRVQGGGFSPKLPSQLDVHHPRPLAEGGEWALHAID